jgi:RNA polymerase sigma-70 factor (ECF subfamily)
LDALTLIDRALHGDEDALRNLVDSLSVVIQARVVRALLRRKDLSGDRDVRQEVEDLTQEVFGSLFANSGRVLRNWDPSRGLSLKNFVGLVAEREVASILRTGKRNPWRDDPTMDGELHEHVGADPGPEQQVALREELELVLDEVRMRLSPLGLNMFEQLIVEGRDAAEVGQELGMSVDAIYAWRSRCAKLVRTVAAELLSGPPSSSRIPIERAPSQEDRP